MKLAQVLIRGELASRDYTQPSDITQALQKDDRLSKGFISYAAYIRRFEVGRVVHIDCRPLLCTLQGQKRMIRSQGLRIGFKNDICVAQSNSLRHIRTLNKGS